MKSRLRLGRSLPPGKFESETARSESSLSTLSFMGVPPKKYMLHSIIIAPCCICIHFAVHASSRFYQFTLANLNHVCTFVIAITD